MAIAVLVIFWVVVGILVVGVAMSATKKSKHEESRSNVRTAVFGLGAAVLIVVGLAVLPAWIMIDNTDANAKTVGGVHLNDNQVHGRELFAANCAVCHTLRASNAVGQTGPNLDTLRPQAAIVEFAIANGFANGGQGQMPKGLLSGDDAKDVASYVQAVTSGGTTTTPTAAKPKLSASATAAGKKVFTADCAACHTLAAAGAKGNVGPNLDQLKPGEAAVAKQVTDGGGAMPAFGNSLSKAQITAVANYVSSVAG